jgi:hypothetical protein
VTAAGSGAHTNTLIAKTIALIVDNFGLLIPFHQMRTPAEKHALGLRYA